MFGRLGSESRNSSIVVGMNVLFVLASVTGWCGDGGEANPALKTDAESLQQWRDMRFGMFVHWGPVSQKGTEIGWSRGVDVPVDEYDRLYQTFNPTEFNADDWIALAKETGMKYFVITSKHHDGFCLWHSQYTDYDMASTPFKRDVLKEMAEACRRQGILFSTYHSIIDWYQPDYIPRGSGDKRPPEDAQYPRYIEYLKHQLKEIIDGYGPLGIMWFDGEWEETWTHEMGMDLYAYVRSLQPNILINNRVDKGRQGMQGMSSSDKFAGDYGTPEQEVGKFERDEPWETCMTVCQQWAWKPNDKLKSLEECISILVNCVGGDGNLLLNVGPMPDGRIEPRQVERLKEIGAWMKANGESIYGTRGGPYKPTGWMASTCQENRIYLHILKWENDSVELPALPVKVKRASLLGGGKVEFKTSEDKLIFSVTKTDRQPLDTIVVLEVEGTAFDIEPIAVELNGATKPGGEGQFAPGNYSEK